MLDRLYSRIVALAESRHAIPALVFVAFAEASFLPLPPDLLLIDSESRLAEVLRREGPHWVTELVRGQDDVLRLASVDLAVPMAELYDGIDLEDAEIAARSIP